MIMRIVRYQRVLRDMLEYIQKTPVIEIRKTLKEKGGMRPTPVQAIIAQALTILNVPSLSPTCASRNVAVTRMISLPVVAELFSIPEVDSVFDVLSASQFILGGSVQRERPDGSIS